MRTLTVRQPWASLIILGHKDVENRTWSTNYRGPLLIHASLRADKSEPAAQALARALPSTRLNDLPLGQIIGAVELVDVVTSSPSLWFSGPFAWLLRDAKQFETGIRVGGALSLWNYEIKI